MSTTAAPPSAMEQLETAILADVVRVLLTPTISVN
jgi:hypothetical protein